MASMLSTSQIITEYRRRERTQSKIHSRMREISKVYNDETILPLPELNKAEKPAVPNLTAQGLDQHSMRVASVVPDLYCPPIRAGFRAHEERARQRELAIAGWWGKSRMPLLLRKRARQLLGYSATPVVIRPDLKLGIPRWHVRDPMTAFPPEWGEPDDLLPADCIFATRHSLAWIQQRWPGKAASIYKGAGDWTADDMFTVLEYYSPQQFTLAVVGRPREQDPGGWADPTHGAIDTFVELENIPNHLGVTPVVFPKRVSLDGSRGQFDGILGMYQTEAMLMALSVHATFKGIFQETWVVDSPNERADIEALPNTMTGEPGVIHGGAIEKFPVDPQFQTNAAMDKLEYGQRSTASIPAEYGGYGGTNVRTGRRGAQVMGAAVDFPIQEHQQILASSMEEENKIAIGIDKAYFGNTAKTFYVSWSKAKGSIEYIPNEIFDTDENIVSYAYAGADENALMILTGQRVGMGTMSKESAMEIDPMVKDVENEKDRITGEALDAAFLSKVQADAANPESPMSGGDLAKLKRLVLTDKMDIETAWDQVQAEIQERQAAAMQAQQEQMQQQQQEMGGMGPAGAVDPAAMPGLEEGTIAPPGESMPGAENLSRLLGTLRLPQMTGQAERGSPVKAGAPG